MYLKALHLRSFRNYLDQQVEFDAQKTILVGNNAQGKSNLLEAVELLATLKSHRAMRDRDLVLEEASAGQIAATLKRAYGTAEIAMTLRSSGRRTVMLNQEPLRRHLDLLGVLNAVEFSSLDLDLVRGSPESRRNWLDTLLIQLEPIYARILQEYQQVLRQRNALLKAIRKNDNPSDVPAESLTTALAQLELWDEQLALTGSRVTRRRARVLARLAPLAQTIHADISGQTEVLEIKYAPNVVWSEDDAEQVQQAFLEKLEQRRVAEQHQGTTVVGPHRTKLS